MMPRYLILVIFCGVLALAVAGGATAALAKDASDGSNNFKQPNLKPYENLASVLKASYKKTSTSNSSSVTKKSSSATKSKSVKKTNSSSKSNLNNKKAHKSSNTASTYKKKNNQKPKSTKKSA